jgi:hypothetical protein
MSLPNAESQLWFSHTSEPVRRLSLPEFWISDISEPPRSQSPHHLWQQTTAVEPKGTKITLQDDDELVERERQFRRNEPFVREADLSSPISPDARLWSPPPPGEPELIKITDEEDC